jgi:hypothetical protein
MKNHVAVYGVTKLKRAYCKDCKNWAFVIDKTFSCCDAIYTENSNKYKRMTDASGVRKRPSTLIIKEILTQQNHKCLYCGIKFGEIYFRNSKTNIAKVAWDHFVPFSYLQENPYYNWIASCSICNLIKSSKIFETVQQVRDYVKYERRKKEIYYLNEELPPMRE